MTGGYGAQYLEIDSAKDSIDTMNVLPFQDETYTVGTSGLRYNEVHTNVLYYNTVSPLLTLNNTFTDILYTNINSANITWQTYFINNLNSTISGSPHTQYNLIANPNSYYLFSLLINYKLATPGGYLILNNNFTNISFNSNPVTSSYSPIYTSQTTGINTNFTVSWIVKSSASPNNTITFSANTSFSGTLISAVLTVTQIN